MTRYLAGPLIKYLYVNEGRLWLAAESGW